MTKAVITESITPRKPRFIGSFDSDAITLTGDVMRLHVYACPSMKDGEKLRVTVKIIELDSFFNQQGKMVDECSNDDVIGEFEGFLNRKGQKFFFSDMKPAREIDWSKTAPYPWFRVTFARETDLVTNKSDNNTDAETFPVVIGKNDEPQESPEFEIGFLITKEDGTTVGHSYNFVSYLYGEYSYQWFLDLFDIHTQLDSINLLNITNAQIKYAPSHDNEDEDLLQATVASTTSVYDGSISAYNDKKMKLIDDALKTIDKLIKTSKNPWFQNIQTVNEYYQKLDIYKSHIEQYQKIQNSVFASQNDCYSMENSIIRPMAIELNRLEDEIHSYLRVTGKPPKAYADRINKNIAIIARNKNIDEILKNPAVQIMGLLPGAGVVTGTLKLIKGDISGGFLDVFGSIVNYGSFLKLARVARVYSKSSKATVELLYSYRYRKLVSSITSAKIMNKITETSLKHSGTFLGNLFGTVGAFKSLDGCVDSIALLHRNRGYIMDMTSKAIAGIQNGDIDNAISFLRFLNRLGNANAAAEFFAHIRLLHATVKSFKGIYTVTLDAMDDVNKLLGFDQLPGVRDFDPLIAENTITLFRMLNDRGVIIDEVIDKQTSRFSSTSSIIDHFNESLSQYDMFGVNKNADIRYQNTRAEMLLALDEISAKWVTEKKDRDNWIKENKHKFIHKYEHELKIQWAKINKSRVAIDLPDSLETRINNFIVKLKGQIILREALEEGTELTFLELIVDYGTVSGTKIIFDFNSDFFCSHGSNLVNKYY